MISLQQFIEKAKSSNPPLLKNYTPKERPYSLQAVDSFLLFLCITVMFLLCKLKQDPSIRFNMVFICVFLLLCLPVFIVWIHPIKNSSHELRKPFPVSKSDWVYYGCAIIIGFFLWIIVGIEFFSLLFLFIFLPLGAIYNSSHLKYKNLYQNVPLARLFSILGIKTITDCKNPFDSVKFLSFPIPIYFSLKVKDENIIFGRVKDSVSSKYRDTTSKEYMIFSVPYSQKENLDKIIHVFQEFLETTTGQDLIFQAPVSRCIYQKAGDKIEIFFTLNEEGILPTQIFMENRYFYYNENDARQLYNDVSKLYKDLKDCFD